MSKESTGDNGIPMFYKVTFTDGLAPVVKPLEANKIWDMDSGGLDKAKPFVLLNPGNGPANKDYFSEALKSKDGADEINKIVAFEAKIFERGVTKCGIAAEERQYLVAINETGGHVGGAKNMELIKRHNNAPDGFISDYTSEQARLIYGPLVTESGITPDGNGTPLPNGQIIENLSMARSYNPSFGTVIANCQTNALAMMMRSLGIEEEAIRDGIEGMRRLDGPNMASISKTDISPSTVIFEGSNDRLAEEFIGGRNPAIPAGHTNRSVVPIDDHRIKIYQEQPIEVYHPGKKPTDEEKAQEDAVIKILPDSLGVQTANPKETTKDIVLDYMGLGGFRFKDQRVHNAPHLTCEPTPGNEIQGRDPDLLYKLMADMLTREDARDVNHYFRKEKAQQLNALDLDIKPGQLDRVATQGGLEHKINADAIEIFGEAVSGRVKQPTESDRLMDIISKDDDFRKTRRELKAAGMQEARGPSPTEKLVNMNMQSKGDAREI